MIGLVACILFYFLVGGKVDFRIFRHPLIYISFFAIVIWLSALLFVSRKLKKTNKYKLGDIILTVGITIGALGSVIVDSSLKYPGYLLFLVYLFISLLFFSFWNLFQTRKGPIS
jgi:hypothetical protein